MTSKLLTLKRILIYLTFAFIPPFAIQLIYLFMVGRDTSTSLYQLIMMLSMLFPAAANFLTRIITKEGFKGSMLKVNFKGNRKYYAIAVLLPVAYTVATAFFECFLLIPKGSALEILRSINPFQLFSVTVYMITISLFGVFLAFGEEFGWRGYLTPKLCEVIKNKPAAYIVSGIVWGLWHAVAVIIGHNFGTDYKLYPFTGILVMCIFCISIGTLFSILTEKTDSIYPASIFHMVNNNILEPLSLFILSSSPSFTEDFSMNNSCVIGFSSGIAPIIFILSACAVINICSRKKEKNVP